MTATVFAALAVTGITACGSDTSGDTSGDSGAAGSSAAATSGAAAHDHSAAPPAQEELQATLDGFVDPAKPTADKAKLMVDGQRRTANIDTMNQGLANYGKITFAVSDVKAEGEGDKATAQVVVNSPHGAAPAMPMSWEHSDAGWQISDSSACRILAMGRAPCEG